MTRSVHIFGKCPPSVFSICIHGGADVSYNRRRFERNKSSAYIIVARKPGFVKREPVCINTAERSVAMSDLFSIPLQVFGYGFGISMAIAALIKLLMLFFSKEKSTQDK